MKKIAVISGSLLLILVLFFCFYKNERIENIAFEMPEEKKEIRIAWNWENDDVKALAFKELMRKFEEKNPNINLKYEYLGNSSFYTNLQVDFASGNETDIVSARPGYTIRELITRGKISSLPYDEQKHSGKVGTYIVNSNVYGISLEKYYAGLLVNCDLLESLGLNVPETYEELIYVADKLKTEDIIPVSCCFPEYQALLYQALICGFGGDGALSEGVDEKGISDAYLWGLELIKELYAKEVFSSDTMEISVDESVRRFKEKEAAMLFVKSGHRGNGELTKLNDRTVLIPFPPYYRENQEEARLCSLGDATFYWSRKSYNDVEKQDILQELFEFITEEGNVKFFSENAKVLSWGETGKEKAFYEYEFVENSTARLLPSAAFDELDWYNYIEHKISGILVEEINPEIVLEAAENRQKSYRK